MSHFLTFIIKSMILYRFFLFRTVFISWVPFKFSFSFLLQPSVFDCAQTLFELKSCFFIAISQNLIDKLYFFINLSGMKFIPQNQSYEQTEKQNPLNNFVLPLNSSIAKPKHHPQKSIKSRKVASKFSPIIISLNRRKNHIAKQISSKQQPQNIEENKLLDNPQGIEGDQNGANEPFDNLSQRSQQQNYKIDHPLDIKQRMTVVLAVSKDNKIIKSDLEVNSSSKELIKDFQKQKQIYPFEKVAIKVEEAINSEENKQTPEEKVKNLAQFNLRVCSAISDEYQGQIVPIKIINEQKLQKQTLQSSKEPALAQKHAFNTQRAQKPSIPSKNLLSQQCQHPAYEQVSLSSKKNQTESKQKLISKRKIADKIPEPIQYTCHCNTRGCRDHYCGCIRRGLQCSTSCLCSDCTNLNDQKQPRVVVKMKTEERMELNDEIYQNLEFGIEFEPVCFLGFGGDEMRENVEANEHRQRLDEEKEQVGLGIQEGRDVLDRAGQSI